MPKFSRDSKIIKQLIAREMAAPNAAHKVNLRIASGLVSEGYLQEILHQPDWYLITNKFWTEFMQKPFQTQRYTGELRKFATFREAFEDGKDSDVWKIVCIIGDERIRLVRTSNSSQFVVSRLTDDMADILREQGHEDLAKKIEEE